MRIGASTLISKTGTCDLLTTIHLTSKDNMIRDVPLQEGDSPNIYMRKVPSRAGMQSHYVRWVKPGTAMDEMARHQLLKWMVPRIKGEININHNNNEIIIQIIHINMHM